MYIDFVDRRKSLLKNKKHHHRKNIIMITEQTRQISSIYELYGQHIDCTVCNDYARQEAFRDFKAFFETRKNAFLINHTAYEKALIDCLDEVASHFFDHYDYFSPTLYRLLSDRFSLEKFCLGGADSWQRYCDGGYGIIPNYDIALMLGGEDLAHDWEDDKVSCDFMKLQAQMLQTAFFIFADICNDFYTISKFAMIF